MENFDTTCTTRCNHGQCAVTASSRSLQCQPLHDATSSPAAQIMQLQRIRELGVLVSLASQLPGCDTPKVSPWQPPHSCRSRLVDARNQPTWCHQVTASVLSEHFRTCRPSLPSRPLIKLIHRQCSNQLFMPACSLQCWSDTSAAAVRVVAVGQQQSAA